MGTPVVVTVPVRWGSKDLAKVVSGGSLGHGTKLRTPPEFEATVISLGPAVRSGGFEPYIQFAVEFGSGVAAGATGQLVATWLWRHFHRDAPAMMIDRTVIDLDKKGRAKRLIQEHIERSSDENE